MATNNCVGETSCGGGTFDLQYNRPQSIVSGFLPIALWCLNNHSVYPLLTVVVVVVSIDYYAVLRDSWPQHQQQQPEAAL